jgi:hypothetical protein
MLKLARNSVAQSEKSKINAVPVLPIAGPALLPDLEPIYYQVHPDHAPGVHGVAGSGKPGMIFEAFDGQETFTPLWSSIVTE